MSSELSVPLLTQSKSGWRASRPSLLQRGWIRRAIAILLMFVAAALLTWKVRVNKQLPCPYCIEASMVGWLYFLMWTVSFYPQLITNFRRKSVEGLSMDFMLMNVVGFACYTVFNVALFSSPTVQQEYKQRFDTISIPVELNDVLFAVHALLLSLTLAVQCLIYPRGHTQRVSMGTSVGLSLTTIGGIVYALAIIWQGEQAAPWTWLDLCYYCSFVKMGVTLVKYIPQVRLNHTRQSTEGWSIDNVLLDLGGGSLSTAQLLINCYVLNDWTAVTGNSIKFALGLTSMVFDAIFILQHYVWFRRRKPTAAQEAAAAGYQQLTAEGPSVVTEGDAADIKGGHAGFESV